MTVAVPVIVRNSIMRFFESNGVSSIIGRRRECLRAKLRSLYFDWSRDKIPVSTQA